MKEHHTNRRPFGLGNMATNCKFSELVCDDEMRAHWCAWNCSLWRNAVVSEDSKNKHDCCVLIFKCSYQCNHRETFIPLVFYWAEARIKIARMTLTIKLDGNWSSFQLANNTPPLSVTGSVIAPSARMAKQAHQTWPLQGSNSSFDFLFGYCKTY